MKYVKKQVKKMHQNNLHQRHTGIKSQEQNSSTVSFQKFTSVAQTNAFQSSISDITLILHCDQQIMYLLVLKLIENRK
jgi:hypothetical protein